MIRFVVTDEADQKFATILNGRRVTFRLRYNPTINRWSMDVSIDGNPVIVGRRLVEGVDLLEPFNLGIGAVFLYSDPQVEPGRNELPQGRINLYHATQEEIDAAMAS